eukprot:jgi/Chrpa1/12324/Chrysochromulina_OHIO_Genome00019345-RA
METLIEPSSSRTGSSMTPTRSVLMKIVALTDLSLSVTPSHAPAFKPPGRRMVTIARKTRVVPTSPTLCLLSIVYSQFGRAQV